MESNSRPAASRGFSRSGAGDASTPGASGSTPFFGALPVPILGVSYDEYASYDAIRSHDLIEFSRSPIRWRRLRGGMRAEATAAMDFGRHFHSAMAGEPLPPISDGPVNQSTGRPYGKETKAFLDWQRQQTEETITSEDSRRITSMTAAIREHPRACELMGDASVASHEVVVRGRACGINCQCRIDMLLPNASPIVVIDFKTCAELSRLQHDFTRFGYHIQFEFYAMLVEMEFGQIPDIYVVAVETDDEFDVGVWRVRFDKSYSAVRELLHRFHRLAQDDQVWPGSHDDIGEIG